MAGITINTGEMQFDNGGGNRQRASGQPLKVLVLSNFSGASSDGGDFSALQNRKIMRLDKDNFDEIFRRMNVQVSIPQLGQTIRFSELDQLHPDYLYQHLEIFSRYRQLVRQLKSPEQFSSAVEALRADGIIDTPSMPESLHTPAVSGNLKESSFLDNLLSGAQSAQEKAAFSAEALIRQTVAPYVEQKVDIKAKEYIAAVEAAAEDLLRGVLHASAFQSVESSWRSLDLLNRRLDTDQSCSLHLLDVSLSELHQDVIAWREGAAASVLFDKLVSANGVLGEQHFDVILLDFPLDSEEGSLGLMSLMAAIARSASAYLLTSLDDGFLHSSAGKWESFTASDDLLARVSPLRAVAGGAKVLAAAPRYMVRLPYGSRTCPIESIAFEELPKKNTQAGYVWGSSAYLLLLALAQLSDKAGGGSLESVLLEGLPLHVTLDEDGDEMVVPTTECYLTEKVVAELTKLGIVAMQSVKNSDSVKIAGWPHFSSVS